MYNIDIVESNDNCGLSHIGNFPFDYEIQESSYGKQTLADIAEQIKELETYHTYTASTCKSQKLIVPILKANGFKIVGITDGAHSRHDIMTYWLRLRKSKKRRYRKIK